MMMTSNERLMQLAENYLAPRGWFLSLTGTPQDANGVVPWLTYPAVEMLTRIIQPDFKVFEFGCGMSTVWWSKRAQVVAVDHNQQWVEKVRTNAPQATVVHRAMGCPMIQPDVILEFIQQNYNLPVSPNTAHNIEHGLLCPEFMGYASEILAYPVGHFDVVVVDGMARVLTAWLAARQLGPKGIVVFDNSERWQYNAGYQLLVDAGFARFDFWGVGPVQGYEWCTSIFTRDLEIFRQNSLIPRGQRADLGW